MGNNSWMNSAFFATFGRTKRRKHYLCLLFCQYWTWAQKNQWSRHLFEKLIPGLFYSKSPRKVNATTLELSATNFENLNNKTINLFSNLDFLPNLSFQKPWICSWISHDFPWISHPWGPMGSHGVPTSAQTRPAFAEVS